MINQSEISVSARHHHVFLEAYRQFRNKEIQQYAQVKFMALKDLPTVQRGVMPGPRKKWIRRESEDWIFHVKFFVLLELADSDLREDLIGIVPEPIQPSVQELLEMEHGIDEPAPSKRTIKQLDTPPSEPEPPEKKDRDVLLVLVESWLRDIGEILTNIRGKYITVDTLRELGVGGTIRQIRRHKTKQDDS